MIAGIDFGTSNTVAGFKNNNHISLLSVNGSDIIPSSIFYCFITKEFFFGKEGVAKFKSGGQGRFFRSLKSFLGYTEEVTIRLGYTNYTIEDLISKFFIYIREQLEFEAQSPITHLNIGRPVLFSNQTIDNDALAESRLRNAAQKAGFTSISFQYEPVAAAISSKRKVAKESTTLIVDIGGGTTDFSLVSINENTHTILANKGTYIGGDNFDGALIDTLANPHIGKGTSYESMEQVLDWPTWPFLYLTQWATLNKLYEKKNILTIKDLHYFSKEKGKIGRLVELIENESIHTFVKEIENLKIALSSNNEHRATMEMFKDPFSIDLNREYLKEILNHLIDTISITLDAVLSAADKSFSEVDTVLMTGGSSQIPCVIEFFEQKFSKEAITPIDPFRSVGIGLIRNLSL